MPAEFEKVWQRLKRPLPGATHLKDKAQKTDEDYWDGVALNLHSYYTGVEQIFEDIARTIDQSVPEGAQWHRDLLLQMSAEIKEVRQQVISRPTRHCLEEYRGFRHVVRNIYTFKLQSERIATLAESINECFEMVQQDLFLFSNKLEEIAD